MERIDARTSKKGDGTLQEQEIQGFELGPIRPPSEAYSLLLRLNRGCGWNKCRFCGFYRDVPFAIRKPEDVKADIDLIKYWIDVFEGKTAGRQPSSDADYEACSMAYHWYQSGMKSVFLQDGNSILMPPADMVAILRHLKETFPQIRRITSYARADTIGRISLDRLREYRALGLDRFHIGLETGSDRILKLMNKGCDKATQIAAGRKAMAAGIEINEFYMPGMGGREWAEESARETADVMVQVDPNFIRIRSMALDPSLEMWEDYASGLLTRPNDLDTIREIRLFLENLDGIHSFVDSDHILNILLELKGQLPQHKQRMLDLIDRFLALPRREQDLFRLGRRLGLMGALRDLDNSVLRDRVQEIMERSHIDEGNIDLVCDKLMVRAIPI